MRSRNQPWRVASFLVAVVLFAGDGLAQGPREGTAEERPGVRVLAPDFTLPDLDGRQVKLSDFRGKKAVFLNFWASWYPSCQEEMPKMEKLYGQFKGQGPEIVAVSIDRAKEDVARFVKAHGITFPVLLDPESDVAYDYHVLGIPTHYFIDKKGVIRVRDVGSKDWSKPETWKAIEGLLQEPQRQ